jgi:hypothetical protein
MTMGLEAVLCRYNLSCLLEAEHIKHSGKILATDTPLKHLKLCVIHGSAKFYTQISRDPLVLCYNYVDVNAELEAVLSIVPRL